MKVGNDGAAAHATAAAIAAPAAGHARDHRAMPLPSRRCWISVRTTRICAVMANAGAYGDGTMAGATTAAAGAADGERPEPRARARVDRERDGRSRRRSASLTLTTSNERVSE